MKWPLILISLFFFHSAANGFELQGHKYLEQEAYKLLRAYPNGAAILDWLIAHEILDEGLPSRSQYPDKSLERQFTQSRQGYHFMTSNANVLHAAHNREGLSPQQSLLIRALPSNLQMVYYFFREVIENPNGSRQAGRGIYVLMHIVADSYSTEHTSRDSGSAELRTVKGWIISRLFWPKIARSKEPGKETLLLLHRKKGPGDHQWFEMNGQDTVLTEAGSNAAKAMCELLRVTYEAANDTVNTDKFICNYIEQQFRPAQTTINDHSFTFSNTEQKIMYNFGDHYQDNKKQVILHYDRFPYYALMFTMQSGFSELNAVNTFGIEYERFVTPRSADRSFSLIRRTPFGYGLGIMYHNYHEPNSTFASALRFKSFMSASFALPMIGASFDPHAGLSFFPAATATRFSGIVGVDLVWNPGNDFYLVNGHPRTIRFSLGYEYDPWNIFLTHSIKVKIGYNTWRGRVVLPRKLRKSPKNAVQEKI
jgi:hypothetical protein